MITPGQRIDWIQRNIINPRTMKPIELMPFQSTFIESVYANGILSAGLSMPRKNGKTGLLAGLALAELDLNPDADVVLGATKVKQASRPSGIYGVMKAYIRLGGLDHLRVSRNNNDPTIKNTLTGGQAEAVAFSDEDAAQGLNPSLCIIDEFGTEFWTPERWAAAIMSMGGRGSSARVIGISTPSSQRSAMYDLRCKVAAGLTQPSFYWQEHSAPLELDIFDPATWALANPALGSFLDAEAVLQDITLPEHLFRLFRLGQWVEGSDESWLGTDPARAWDATADEYDFVDGAPTWVGLDYARKFDTSAIVYGQMKPDGIPHFKCKIYAPTEQGNVDLQQIGNYLHSLHERYDLRSVHYDPYGLQFLAEHLMHEGLPMVEVQQRKEYMVPAVMNCRTAIFDKQLTHDTNDAFRTQILNAVPHRYDEGFSLEKRKSAGKIDAAVALCFAHHATLTVPAVTNYRIYAL